MSLICLPLSFRTARDKDCGNLEADFDDKYLATSNSQSNDLAARELWRHGIGNLQRVDRRRRTLPSLEAEWLSCGFSLVAHSRLCDTEADRDCFSYTQADSGAWFLAASTEGDLASQHMIQPNG